MIRSYLKNKQLARVKRAAKYAGLQWQAIAARPKTAMQFCRRVEEEMRRKGALE